MSDHETIGQLKSRVAELSAEVEELRRQSEGRLTLVGVRTRERDEARARGDRLQEALDALTEAGHAVVLEALMGSLTHEKLRPLAEKVGLDAARAAALDQTTKETTG